MQIPLSFSFGSLSLKVFFNYLFSKKKMLPVNFVPWRTSHSALSQMILQRSQALHKAQAILAKVNLSQLAQLLRVRRKVPRLKSISAQLEPLEVLDARCDVVVGVLDHGSGAPWPFLLVDILVRDFFDPARFSPIRSFSNENLKYSLFTPCHYRLNIHPKYLPRIILPN